MRGDWLSAARVALGGCVFSLLSLQTPLANAQAAEGASGFFAPSSASAGPASAFARTATTPVGYSIEYSPARPYFVEFRSRHAESYGHMYVMYGEANERHEIIRSEIAGFFPAGDTQNCLDCSVYYWTIGHVLPVPSEIGASDGDLEEQYVTARFRIWIDLQQYQRLVAYISQRKAYGGPWNAFYANCVTFGRDVAAFLNVKMPLILQFAPSVVMYPQDVVELIREANGVHEDQGPLLDAPGSLPPEVAAQIGEQPTTITARHNSKKLTKSTTGRQDYQRTAVSKIH
jgi:hypothetical protein